MGRVMIAYAVARLIIALTGLYDAGWRIEVLFWWCFVLWLLGLGVSHSVRVCVRLTRSFR
jgi:hypothetical protein